MKCKWCLDTGILRAIAREIEKPDSLMRCDCEAGNRSIVNIPQYNHLFVEDYARAGLEPLPIGAAALTTWQTILKQAELFWGAAQSA